MAKIAVVGAGLAGMTAAARLVEAGHEARVFEAEAEVGGRTCAAPFGSHWVNLGAQYLAGDDTPAVRLARKHNLPTMVVGESAIAVHRGGRTVVSRSLPVLLCRLPLSLRGRWSVVRSGLRLERLRAGLGQLSKPDLRALDAQSFGALIGKVHPEAGELFRSMAVRMACGEPEEMSALLGLSWTPSFRPRLLGGHRPQRIFAVVGGTGRLAQTLASGLPSPPRLSTRVTRVQSRPQGVVIETEHEAHTADAVVLSTPAAATAKIAASLNPALKERLAAVRYGSFVVVGFAFDQSPPFPWDRVYAVQVAEPPFHAAINETWPVQDSNAPVATTIVKLMLGGRYAREMSEQPDPALYRQGLRVLRQISPDLEGEPVAQWIKRWPLGLPFWTPGQLSRGRLPVDQGSIQLAGDYTDYPNTQGAVKSGHLAAENLIARFR